MNEMRIVIQEPEGYLDTPWGSQLRDIETRVRKADEAGVIARWEFGKHFLKRREGRKQLPHGLVGEVEEKLGVSEREIQYRVKLAEELPTEDEVRKALRTYGSWWGIIKNVLTQRREKAESGSSQSPLFIRRARKQLSELHAQDLSDEDLDALREIMDEIERIFSEVAS